MNHQEDTAKLLIKINELRTLVTKCKEVIILAKPICDMSTARDIIIYEFIHTELKDF
jgi:hypothetical protein